MQSNAINVYEGENKLMRRIKLYIAGIGLLASVAMSAVTAYAADATNLINNASVETADGTNPASWTANAWGTNTPTFTYASDGHTGNRSLYVNLANRTDGDAKWIPAASNVSANTYYTYSSWYKSSVATEIDAQVTSTDGTVSYQYITSVPASSSWKQLSTTFTTPAGAKSVSVLQIIASNGWLQTDDFTLAPTVTAVASSDNYIVNGSFETANGSAPANWSQGNWGNNTASFSYDTTGHTGSRSATITVSKYTDGDAKWVFDPVAVTSDTQYTYSDYYKATVQTEVVAAFDMPDGSTTYETIGLPDASTSWAQFSTTFTVPKGASSMSVYHLIQSKGTLTIDDASLGTFTPIGFNRGLVSLTFDDGYDSNYSTVLPLLNQNNIKGTFYLVSGLLGSSGYLSNSQAKALATAGNEIGSHTLTHAALNAESTAAFTKELSQSKTNLQSITGAQVTTFAYPEGLYNKATQTVAARYYAAQRGVEAGLNAKNNLNLQDIKVQNVGADTTTAELQDWLNQAAATKTWLVLVYHSVYNDATHGEYNVTPANLGAQLAAIKASGLTVTTMAQAVSEVTAQK